MNDVFGEILQQCADNGKLRSSLFSDSSDCHADQIVMLINNRLAIRVKNRTHELG